MMILIPGWGYSQSSQFSAAFKSLVNGEPILYAKVTNSNGESLLTNVDGLVTIFYRARDGRSSPPPLGTRLRRRFSAHL